MTTHMDFEIFAIDAAIDANHRAVMARLHFGLNSCVDWGNAWTRCPDLHLREKQLGSARYDARERAYAYEAKMARREAVRTRYQHRTLPRCPACNQVVWKEAA